MSNNIDYSPKVKVYIDNIESFDVMGKLSETDDLKKILKQAQKNGIITKTSKVHPEAGYIDIYLHDYEKDINKCIDYFSKQFKMHDFYFEAKKNDYNKDNKNKHKHYVKNINCTVKTNVTTIKATNN